MTEPPVNFRARDLGEVVLKLMGIYFILFSLSATAAFLTIPTDGAERQSGLLGSVVVLFVTFGVGVALIRGAASISAKLFGAVSEVAVPLPSHVEFQSVVFRSLGLFVLVGALPGLAELLTEAVLVKSWPETAPRTASLVTQLACGVALLLYRTNLARSLGRRLRPLSAASREAGAP